MQWVASTLHTTSEHGVSSITTADVHTSAVSSRLNWRPRWFNGLVHFTKRQNLVSARVPSHFNWPVLCSCCIAAEDSGVMECYVMLAGKHFEGSWCLNIQGQASQNLHFPENFSLQFKIVLSLVFIATDPQKCLSFSEWCTDMCAKCSSPSHHWRNKSHFYVCYYFLETFTKF